jgi:hypothetical protein
LILICVSIKDYSTLRNNCKAKNCLTIIDKLSFSATIYQ